LGGSRCGDGHHGGLVLVDGAQVSWRAVSELCQRRFQLLRQRHYDLPMYDAALAPAFSLSDPAAGFIDVPHPAYAALRGALLSNARRTLIKAGAAQVLKARGLGGAYRGVAALRLTSARPRGAGVQINGRVVAEGSFNLSLPTGADHG